MQIKALLWLAFFASSLSSCSSTPKKTPELSKLKGKRVALIEIEGEETQRRIVEVALINQLVKHGSFILISKKEVEKAKSSADHIPGDRPALAKKLRADYLLTARVLEFDAPTYEIYSEHTVFDETLEKERGDGKAVKIFKEKTIGGSVKVELSFIDPTKAEDSTRTAVAESSEKITRDNKKGAIHLPPKLRFLEKIANRAFEKFFKKYQ